MKLVCGVCVCMCVCCQLIAEHPMFADNSVLQQQLKHMMPQYIQQVRFLACQQFSIMNFLPESSHSVSRPEVTVGDRTWDCLVNIYFGVLLYLV